LTTSDDAVTIASMSKHGTTPPKEPGTWTRLDRDDRAFIERLAQINDRSVAAEVRQAVKFYRAAHNDDGTMKS
jgi:hypothetical protein